MSAFTEPLAQVREAIWRAPGHVHEDALAALAQVERLATDYEAALETIANGAWPKDVQASVSVSNLARAVLSAREEGADTR